MSKIWIQDWGTYGEETLVCVAASKREILAFLRLKKISGRADFIAAVTRDFEIPKNCDGCFFYNQSVRGSILWFQSLELTPHSVGILAHEVTHAVRRLLIEERNMENEIEAICYQTEYLTKNILREALK